MANYTSKLTPDLINMDTEASMDTSVLNGVSIQRTINVLDVVNEDGSRKQVSSVKDGDSFNDVVEESEVVPTTTSAPVPVTTTSAPAPTTTVAP